MHIICRRDARHQAAWDLCIPKEFIFVVWDEDARLLAGVGLLESLQVDESTRAESFLERHLVIENNERGRSKRGEEL